MGRRRGGPRRGGEGSQRGREHRDLCRGVGGPVGGSRGRRPRRKEDVSQPRGKAGGFAARRRSLRPRPRWSEGKRKARGEGGGRGGGGR